MFVSVEKEKDCIIMLEKDVIACTCKVILSEEHWIIN